MSSMVRAEHCSLVIVDIQERLLPVMFRFEELLDQTSVLMQSCQMLDIPVLVTEQYPRGLGKTHESLANLVETTSVYEKTTFSAFPSIQEPLSRHPNRKQIILAGIEAHVCVLQSAFDFLDAGYEVFIPFDAVASRHPENKGNAMARMEKSGITITNIESVIFECLKDSQHPNFKDISNLLK